MSRIIYGRKFSFTSAGLIRPVQEMFAAVASLHQQMRGQRLAYAFIDPLMHGFEAGNRFYFDLLQTKNIDKLNYYRSGAGPLHALYDAHLWVKHNLYDAVFIFGYEPLLSNKLAFGKQAVNAAMDIFNGPNLLACYNGLAEIMCRELGLSVDEFSRLASLLFANYTRTARRLGIEPIAERGPYMAEAGAPLFRLSDCANPNLDFAAGIIVSSEKLAQNLGIDRDRQLDILAVSHTMVQADPYNLSKITGNKNNLFPHIAAIVQKLEQQAGIDIKHHLNHGNLLLDVYTCYPPIPLGFLLASGLLPSVRDLEPFLEQHEITITAGLNLGLAPWNNPVLGSLVAMLEQLAQTGARYGLVHGNGGIGENQAIALLART